MPSRTELSYCAAEVQRLDHDRFLTSLFAPAAKREALFALYAFNIEIAKTRETVSEPLIGQMRLQWWRDAIEEIFGDGPVRRHAVVQHLEAAVIRHDLARADLDALIDARELDLEDRPFATIEALESYANQTTVPLARLSLRTLEVETTGQQAVYDAAATAFALVGLVRALPFRLAHNQEVLPDDLARAHAVDKNAMKLGRAGPGLSRAVSVLLEPARRHLAHVRAEGKACPRDAAAVLLQASLARSYLSQLGSAGYDPFHPRLSRRPALLPATLWWRAALRRF